MNASRKGVLEKGPWKARALQVRCTSSPRPLLPPQFWPSPPNTTTTPGAKTRPSLRLPPNRTTYHRELAVSEPHDPAGAFSCSAPARHPPRHNAAWPPGEAPKFPPHQLPNAKAPAVLEPQGAEVITWWSRGPATLIPPWQPQPWASEGQDSQEGAPSEGPRQSKTGETKRPGVRWREESRTGRAGSGRTQERAGRGR